MLCSVLLLGFFVLSAFACSPEVTVTSSSPTPFVSPRGIFNTNQRTPSDTSEHGLLNFGFIYAPAEREREGGESPFLKRETEQLCLRQPTRSVDTTALQTRHAVCGFKLLKCSSSTTASTQFRFFTQMYRFSVSPSSFQCLANIVLSSTSHPPHRHPSQSLLIHTSIHRR